MREEGERGRRTEVREGGSFNLQGRAPGGHGWSVKEPPFTRAWSKFNRLPILRRAPTMRGGCFPSRRRRVLSRPPALCERHVALSLLRERHESGGGSPGYPKIKSHVIKHAKNRNGQSRLNTAAECR